MNPALASSDPALLISATSAPDPRRTLLIVDDDPSVRHALWITFRDLYQVNLAESAAKALESFHSKPADVALLDVRMPGMSGIELLSALKKLDPGVEVILLSAYETVDYIRDAMRLGAYDYLTKPYEVERVRGAVSNAMNRRDVSRKTAGYDTRLVKLENEIYHQQVREELARTRNEIYASIIHDINGPLTVIAGYVELMQHMIQHAQVLEDDQLSTLRSHAHNVSLQVSNCIELSRRYLGFLEGKLTASGYAEIREIFYDVAELLKAHPQARRNELIIVPFVEDVTAAIHRTDLLQILLNLTINGLQASSAPHRVEIYGKTLDPGGPRPFLDNAANTLLIRGDEFQPAGRLVALTVQDNGPGIPGGLLPRIFDPYFTTKSPGQGTGLGLSIVRRLVCQARGAVHVYSHLGEGAVFTVYLPIRGVI
jgi:two-component system, sensor histidine kinase and response regulator